MRTLKLATCVLVAGLIAAPAMANDAMNWCQTFAAANDRPVAPCDCITAALEANAALREEALALVTVEDFDAASEELKSTIMACVESDAG